MSTPKRQRTDTTKSSSLEVLLFQDQRLRNDKNGGLLKLKLRNEGLPAQDRNWLWITAATQSTEFEKPRGGTRLVSDSVVTIRCVCFLWRLGSCVHLH